MKALHMLAEDNDQSLPLASTLTPGAIGRMHSGYGESELPKKIDATPEVNVTPVCTAE